MITRNTILIVDDMEMNRAMLMKIFADDYIVYTAENGVEALEILDEQDIDMVLLDLNMPEMDGYEVIEKMRANKKLSSVPIVVTTGASDKSERRAFDLGADDFITKPFDPYIVKKRVENLIMKYVLQLDNLRQALGQSEQLSKAKSTFLSRMSHDLRSPVNSIISVSNLLKDAKDKPDQVEHYADKIAESSQYLLGVINDILDMSAIENEKIVITKAPFDFRKTIESVASMFYAQCKEKDIDFRLYLSDFTEEFLFGDSLRLKEVLINLISNAVKFTPQGGKISVRVKQLARVSSMVKLRFEVADNGEGIAKERQEQVFKPFVQENADTMQKHGGSGLGLSIVKNIVELMGGQISLVSTKGQGSNFIVDIPFTVSKEIPTIDNKRLKNVRALIIDDDVETQTYGRKVMTKMGIQCEVANNGEEALKIMKKAYDESRGFDLTFVDWRMPGMSGIEITRAIRATFSDDTVIVVASAYDLGEIAQEAKMAGANVVVPKPMFQSTVFDLLMQITGGQYQHEGETDYQFKGKKILITEDNTLNAEVASDIVGIAGFSSDRAKDGKEACDLFISSPEGTYDAILMDIQMPVCNGYEATKIIRASDHPQAKKIPIIAVTANAFTEDVKAALEAGMNELVAKPIDSERLYQVLDQLIGASREEEE